MLHLVFRHRLAHEPEQPRSAATAARGRQTIFQATSTVDQGTSEAGGHLYAVISDVHANLQALQAVYADANQVAHEEHLPAPVFLCLGDVVDYGPQPKECMDYLNERVRPLVWLRGNHDHEAAKDGWVRPNPGRVDPRWWPMTLWTRQQLPEAYRHDLRGYAEGRDWTNSIGRFWLCHSTPRNDDTYVSDVGNALGVLNDLARLGFRRGLFGHTHHQQLFFRDFNDRDFSDKGKVKCFLAEPEDADYLPNLEVSYRRVNEWHSLPDWPILINPGSVGQPRSHPSQTFSDYRAAYLLLYNHSADGLRFQWQWRRVEYAVHTTQELLRHLEWPDASLTGASGPANGKNILKDDPADPHEASQRSFNILSEEEREQLKRNFRSLTGELADELGRDTRRR